jgi:two-component system, sensor histidine kinase YesM
VKLIAIIHKTNNLRLKSKLMISFILVVFIPVLIVGVFLTYEFRQHVLNQATEQTLNNIAKIKTRTADILRMPIKISTHLLVDKRLANLVNTEFDSTYATVKPYLDYTVFKDYVSSYDEIYNIRFYSANPNVLSNWDILQPNEEVVRSSWYQEILTSEQESISWYYIADETKENRRYLSLIRKINFLEYGTSGVLVIGIDESKLHSIVGQEPFDTMIIDDKGYITAAKKTDWVGLNIESADFSKVLKDKDEGIFDFTYNGERSKIVIEPLLPEGSRNGMKVVSVFTIDSIVREANGIGRLGFTIILISLLIAVVLIFLTSSLLTRRLLLLNKVMNKVSIGDLDAVSIVDGNDEIGLLSRQLNHMVSSIRGLMEEVAVAHDQKTQLELKQRDIKLKMMSSQINPHFLYNALESIRMKAHIQGQTEIANIVKLLGKLMRRSIEIGARKIHMKEELEIARYYLEIQHFRYGQGRLTFEFDVDEAGNQVEIPALIIQPLVENAVVHGLENMESGGFVRITTRLRGAQLYVEIFDNGVGMTEEKLKSIEQALEDREEVESHRIGIRNVHQRLMLTYGEGSGLSIQSALGGGTRVAFQLPTRGNPNNVQGAAGR